MNERASESSSRQLNTRTIPNKRREEGGGASYLLLAVVVVVLLRSTHQHLRSRGGEEKDREEGKEIRRSSDTRNRHRQAGLFFFLIIAENVRPVSLEEKRGGSGERRRDLRHVLPLLSQPSRLSSVCGARWLDSVYYAAVC